MKRFKKPTPTGWRFIIEAENTGRHDPQKLLTSTLRGGFVVEEAESFDFCRGYRITVRVPSGTKTPVPAPGTRIYGWRPV